MVMLITVAELASAMHRAMDAFDAATAEQAIETASAFVEDQTGMAFTSRTAIVKVPAVRDQTLRLPFRPITAVNAVSIGGTVYTDFTLMADGTLYRALSWRTAYVPQDIQATVTYGTTVTPDSIKGVVAEVAEDIFDQILAVGSEAIDDHRVSYTGELSYLSRMTLAKYGAGAMALSMRG